MRLRCKAGDLAIITKEERGCEANIGRVVRVDGPIVVREGVGATWLIFPAGAEDWRVIGRCPAREAVVRHARGPKQLADIEHPDQWMVPLRGTREPTTNDAKAAPRMRQAAAIPTVAEPRPTPRTGREITVP